MERTDRVMIEVTRTAMKDGSKADLEVPLQIRSKNKNPRSHPSPERDDDTHEDWGEKATFFCIWRNESFVNSQLLTCIKCKGSKASATTCTKTRTTNITSTGKPPKIAPKTLTTLGRNEESSPTTS